MILSGPTDITQGFFLCLNIFHYKKMGLKFFSISQILLFNSQLISFYGFLNV